MLNGDSGAAEKLQAAIAEVRAAENRLEEVSLALNCAEQENMQLQQRLAHMLAEQETISRTSLELTSVEASDGSSLSISDMRQLPESRRELAAPPSALSQKRQSPPGSWRPALADSAPREGLALPQERPLDRQRSLVDAEVQKQSAAAAEHASEVERLARLLSKQQEEHNERFTNWTVEKDELNALVAALQSEVKALTGDLDGLKAAQSARRDAAQAEEARLKSALVAAQQERDTLFQQVSSLEAQLLTVKSDGQSQQKELTAQLSTLKTELGTAKSDGQRQQQALESELAALKAKLDTARSDTQRQQEAAASQLSELGTKLAAAQKEEETLSGQVAALENELAAAKSYAEQQLSAARSEARKEREALAAQVSALEAQLATAKAEAAKLQETAALADWHASTGEASNVEARGASSEHNGPSATEATSGSAQTENPELAAAREASRKAQEQIEQLRVQLQETRNKLAEAATESSAAQGRLEAELANVRRSGYHAAIQPQEQPQQKFRSRGLFSRLSSKQQEQQKPRQQAIVTGAAAMASGGAAMAAADSSARGAAGPGSATAKEPDQDLVSKTVSREEASEALQALRTEHAEIVKEHSAAQEAHANELSDLSKALQKAETKVQELQEALNKLQGSEGRSEDWQQAIKKLQREKSELQRELDDQKQAAEKAQNELAAAIEGHGAAARGFDSEKSQLAASLEASQSQIRQLEQTMQELHAASEDLEMQVGSP